MNKEILRQIGFLDAEIEIYFALLRVGPCMVSRLNKETGLHRTHIYDLLEKLREKGLASVFIESGKKHFQAAPPENILSYLEERKVAVRDLIPEIKKLATFPREETSIELFKGKNGLKTVFQDVLKTGKNYCVMGNIRKFEEIIEFAFPHFLKEIERRKIKERIISDKEEGIIKIKTGTYKVIKSEYLFPSSFWVYGKKVVIFVWNPPYFAIVINNAEVAKTYQNYFEFFWKIAQK